MLEGRPNTAERAPDGRSFVDWNDDMIARFDPGAYHERSNFLIRIIERARTRCIVRMLEARPRDRVLEVGVGAGNVLERISSSRRVGLDLSFRILASARRRLGGTAELMRADAAALPFASGSFDRILCSEVLEHLPHPAAAVAEMARVLCKGGVVVLSVPNERFIDRFKGALARMRVLSLLSSKGYSVPTAMKDEWHLHEFDLDLLLQIAGGPLRIERVEAVPHPLVPFRYVARCRAL